MSRRLAVVEDNPDNRLLVEAILEDDYALELYEDGPEALAGLADTRVDLVLLDISLPGMNGEEVLRHLRKIEGYATIPVIALTAHAMAGDREHFLSIGFDGYVSKPIVDEDVLLEAIVALL